ncbi:MAG: hypothetical protein ACYCQK_02705 [Acidiferrobacteraceae bacterium]
MNAQLKKTLLVSHGDKGGVSKSYNSMLKTEFLLAAGIQVALVESDPTQPDVAARYAGDPDVMVGALSLNQAGDAENALSRFGEWLESTRHDHVVVNLPAGAGETLDAQGDLLRELTTALGYRLVVTYALEKNRVAAEALARSLTSGLLSHVAPENRFVVLPAYKGAPESFEWLRHPARAEFAVPEIVTPALNNRSALQKLEATPGRVSALADRNQRPEGWMILDQSSVHRWYHQAIAAIAPVFAEIDK